MTLSISSNARLLLWASASFILVIAMMLTAALVYQARTGSSSAPDTRAEVDLAQPLAFQLGSRVIAVVCGAILVGSVTLALLGIDIPPAVLVVAWIPLGVRTIRAERKIPVVPVPIAS